MWETVSAQPLVTTNPPGATVSVSFRNAEAETLGVTPLKTRIPREYGVWEIKKDGHATVELVSLGGHMFRRPISLYPEDSPHSDMALVVPGNAIRLWLHGLEGRVEGFREFLIDKCEVTNSEYQEFVDAGGYSNRQYWKHEFIEDGRELGWQEAMHRFRDTTGKPGPKNWVEGRYPEGKAEFPVCGVSWYEAAAYAEFVGKSLPTIYHWSKAAELFNYDGYVSARSNFEGKGLAPVGTFGLGPQGTYDLAGNVKEWCWNEAGQGRRFTLGGSWKEPRYMYHGSGCSPTPRTSTGVWLSLRPATRWDRTAPRLAEASRPGLPRLSGGNSGFG